MNRKDLLSLHKQTTDKCYKIFKAKNSDYACESDDALSNFRTSEVVGVPAPLGVLVRVMDKVQRIRSFATKGELQVKGESVDDAIEDIINYMILLKGVIKDLEPEAGAPTFERFSPLPTSTEIAAVSDSYFEG